MRATKPEDRKCKHPDFRYCVSGACRFIFIFERSRYIKPTEYQIARYRLNKAIVEAHDGQMIHQEYACAGQREPFTSAEVRGAIQAVIRDNPDLKIQDQWNGEGAYTLSVGCKERR